MCKPSVSGFGHELRFDRRRGPNPDRFLLPIIFLVLIRPAVYLAYLLLLLLLYLLFFPLFVRLWIFAQLLRPDLNHIDFGHESKSTFSSSSSSFTRKVKERRSRALEKFLSGVGYETTPSPSFLPSWSQYFSWMLLSLAVDWFQECSFTVIFMTCSFPYV